MHILVIEDENKVAQAISDGLQSQHVIQIKNLTTTAKIYSSRRNYFNKRGTR